MNAIELLQDAEVRLAKAGSESPRLDAEVLLAHASGIERVDLYLNRARHIDDKAGQTFSEFIARREAHEPIAYITGTKEFWSMPVRVTADVLIPRPDTEILIDRVLDLTVDRNKRIDILDLCTGSGNIPMALCSELPNAKITMTDISEAAIKIARENTEFAKARIVPLVGDLFEPLATFDLRSSIFDIITANPPYITSEEINALSRDILDFEPEAALHGGKSGLDILSRILKDAKEHLKDGGWLVMEIGATQAETVAELGHEEGYSNMHVKKDLAGMDRIVSMQREI